MTTLVLETPEGVDLSREIAGPGSRSAACVIDVAVVIVGYLMLALVSFLAAQFGISNLPGAFVQGSIILIPIAYPAAAGIFFDGRTVGKFLMGLRVVGDGGYPAGPLQHLMRSIFWPIEIVISIPLPIGLILIGITYRHQRIGDLIAGTVVVRDGRPALDHEPYQSQTWSKLPRRSLDLSASRVAELDRRDYDLIRSLLARRKMDYTANRRLYVRVAKHYCERLNLGNFQDSRIFLMELFLFLRERQGR